jgi:hypothetical protein
MTELFITAGMGNGILEMVMLSGIAWAVWPQTRD